jgi:acyl-coenzyme A thioesterase PaaI-like protein
VGAETSTPTGPPPLPDLTDPSTLAAMERLGGTARRLVEAVVRTAVGQDDVLAASLALEAVCADLEQAQHDGMSPDTEDFVRSRVPLNPVIGTVNPYSFPMTTRVLDDDTVEGEVTLTRVHEGPPGWVHGGIVALLLDQLLGHAIAAAGQPGMTAELRVRYRRPTPFGVPLRLSAAFVHTEGRTIHGTGRIEADGVVTADASGVFLRPSDRARRTIFEAAVRPVDPTARTADTA